MRILSLLVVALFGTSCFVPPSCFDRTFHRSAPDHKYFIGLTVYAKPIAEPKRRYAAGFGMWELFASGASIDIDSGGTIAVKKLNMVPRSCTGIAQQDLTEVAGYWDRVLEPMVRHQTTLIVMPNPPTGKEDWRPDGPLLSFSIVSASGKIVQLLWDGQSRLPQDLDRAVMGTLELMYSKNRLAKRYLLRDLPPQATSRLERERN